MEDTYPKFWRKAIKGSVGGRVLNKKGDIEDFLLKGDPTDADADVDALTLEILDEDAEKYFRKNNKSAIVQGYLIKISEHVLTLDETNAVSDGYLKELLKKPLSKMRVRVDNFTSPVPVYRLLEFAQDENKQVNTIEYLRSVIMKLEGPSGVPTGAQIGGVQVKTL